MTCFFSQLTLILSHAVFMSFNFLLTSIVCAICLPYLSAPSQLIISLPSCFPSSKNGEIASKNSENDNVKECLRNVPSRIDADVTTGNITVCQEDATITFRTFTNNGADESSAALICLKVRVW